MRKRSAIPSTLTIEGHIKCSINVNLTPVGVIERKEWSQEWSEEKYSVKSFCLTLLILISNNQIQNLVSQMFPKGRNVPEDVRINRKQVGINIHNHH